MIFIRQYIGTCLLCLCICLCIGWVVCLYKNRVELEYHIQDQESKCAALLKYQPSLCASNTEKMNEHIAVLKKRLTEFEYKEHTLPQEVNSVEFLLSLDAFEEACVLKCKQAEITLGPHFCFKMSDFIKKDQFLTPEVLTSIHLQKIFLETLLEALILAKPKVLLSLQHYPFVEKETISKPYFKSQYLGFERIGVFKVSFIGYTPSLRLIINTLVNKSFPVLIHSIEVRPMQDRYPDIKPEENYIVITPKPCEYTVTLELMHQCYRGEQYEA